MVKVCNALCPDTRKILGVLSMSRNTIGDCVYEMDTDLRAQLMGRSKDLIACTQALNESMDVKDTAQLVVFRRGVDSKLCVTEKC